MFSLLLSLQSMAHAVPLQMTHQGRLLDANGAAVTGVQSLTFTIFDDPNNGTDLWTETLSVSFNNGYYAAVLGADEIANPLDSLILGQYPLFLEIQVAQGTPLSPRTTLQSVPYAQISGTAESVDGGSVNASEVSIATQPVINAQGEWVGSPISISWSDIDASTIPGDLADGDNDTQLSESTVEAYITNGAIGLAQSSTVQGQGLILTESSTIQWSQLDASTIPAGLADGDDVLNENTVENMITNGPLDLASNTTVNGEQIITTPPSCFDGQILSFDAGSGLWNCIDFSNIIDQDADGILAWNDCNDFDASLLAVVNDADCDGIVTADDCDDNNAFSNAISDDADCDGLVAALDCDDNNAAITTSGTGDTASCAASTCQEIRSEYTSSQTGLYWISPDGGSAYEAYCDMTTDGGGWTLLGTVYGGDTDNWNTEFGYWSDTSTLGSVSTPFQDYKSEAWIDYDLSSAEVMLERRYNSSVQAQARLSNACLHSKSYFYQLFTTWDTSLKCNRSEVTVITPATSTTGLQSSSYQEGVGSNGLGSSGTNGWCWNGGDNNANTFKGHAGWNQNTYNCYGRGHLGYVGVFDNGHSQYTNTDITGTNWLNGTNYALTSFSFYVR